MGIYTKETRAIGLKEMGRWGEGTMKGKIEESVYTAY